MKSRASRGTLLDVAYDAAWKLRAYGLYGSSQAKALKSIKKRCPGFSERQYSNALDKSLELYSIVEQLVSRNEGMLWNSVNEGKQFTKTFDEELKRKFPAFKLSTIRGAVGMMFYYFHMK